jgi:hypothetical protein
MKQAGGRLLSYYLTFGEYDFLLVAEAPDESAMAAAVLAAASGGGVTDVRTTLALTPGDAMGAFEAAAGLAPSFKSAGQEAPSVQGRSARARSTQGEGEAASAARRTRGGRVSPSE